MKKTLEKIKATKKVDDRGEEATLESERKNKLTL